MRILGPYICEESQASSPLKVFDKMPETNLNFLQLFFIYVLIYACNEYGVFPPILKAICTFGEHIYEFI